MRQKVRFLDSNRTVIDLGKFVSEYLSISDANKIYRVLSQMACSDKHPCVSFRLQKGFISIEALTTSYPANKKVVKVTIRYDEVLDNLLVKEEVTLGDFQSLLNGMINTSVQTEEEKEINEDEESIINDQEIIDSIKGEKR